ncbi:MAG: hypothetical protein JW973_06260 [Bacteroidales bacterium]|nr:hypothetical protein [Bacteroidales bacterium]
MANTSKHNPEKPGQKKSKQTAMHENKPYGKKKQSQPKKGFLVSTEEFFQRNLLRFFIASLLLSAILAGYLFDVKIDEGGDDSNYILMAYNFLKGKSYPTWHGEFYSIFISLPILVFGINVVVLKIFSYLFILGHLIFFYMAFRNRISATALVITMLIVSVSSNILFFSSQTYSEAMFMFIQSVGFFIFFKLMDKLPENRLNQIKLWNYWLLLGFTVLVLMLTRNIGITFLLAVIMLLIIEKKFFAILYTIAGYFVFSIPYSLFKKIVWGIEKSAFSQQMEILLFKNPYNAALGKEDFSGMAIRFVANLKMYLSRYFFSSIGLRDIDKTETSLFPAIILIVLFLIGLYFAFRRNRYVLFVAFYLGIAIFTTFVTLNQSWGQLRMIVIYIPLMVLFLLWTFIELAGVKKLRFVFPLLLILCTFLFFKSLGQTLQKAQKNQKVLAKTMRGNLYYGFTPDWQNFLKMSEWVGKNLPDSTVVVSRKPSMSFIYSKGKEFYPMYRFPTENADTLVARLLTRTGPLIAIQQNELFEKNIPFTHQLVTKPSIVAVVSQENDVYTLHKESDVLQQPMESFIRQYQVTTMDADSLLRLMHNNNKSFYGISPDTLLLTLSKNKVEYAIAANLRANPKAKTERIINTVQRYLYIIEMKYPGIFTVQHQIGSNDNEPALLYKINYGLYGIHIP